LGKIIVFDWGGKIGFPEDAERVGVTLGRAGLEFWIKVAGRILCYCRGDRSGMLQEVTAFKPPGNRPWGIPEGIVGGAVHPPQSVPGVGNVAGLCQENSSPSRLRKKEAAGRTVPAYTPREKEVEKSEREDARGVFVYEREK